jgi:hypothetical protein
MRENPIEMNNIKKVVTGVETGNSQFADTVFENQFPEIDESLLDADTYRIDTTPSPAETHFSGNKPLIEDVTPSAVTRSAVETNPLVVAKILNESPAPSAEAGENTAVEDTDWMKPAPVRQQQTKKPFLKRWLGL